LLPAPTPPSRAAAELFITGCAHGTWTVLAADQLLQSIHGHRAFHQGGSYGGVRRLPQAPGPKHRWPVRVPHTVSPRASTTGLRDAHLQRRVWGAGIEPASSPVLWASLPGLLAEVALAGVL